MKGISGTENIYYKNGYYTVSKVINGLTCYVGNCKTLIQALMIRDWAEQNNWKKYPKIKPIPKHKPCNPLRNIQKTQSNKFTIRKSINYKTYSFGSYNTLEEALKFRDYFERNNWPLTERFKYSTPEFIQKVGDKFKVEKSFGNRVKGNRKRYSYGTYDTLEEAIQRRDECIKNDWSRELIPDNPLKYIRKNGNSYCIQHKENGVAEYYGTFSCLDDALKERDLLISCDWDYDALESIDETQSDGLKFIEGKKAKGFHYKHPNGINDAYWFNKVIREVDY